jgi:hypothetical protein
MQKYHDLDMAQKKYDISAFFNHNINQEFYIPITNKYGHVKIELVTKTWKGFLAGSI